MERIEVSALRKTFTLKQGQTITVDGIASNRIPVLDGVDLTINRGEFITLVGPSGSGKSVLLDVIAGLTEATSGVARIDGIEVAKPHARTAYVFQQYALFPWRTALQNVEYALEVRGVAAAERREKARYFLHLFGLKGFEDRFPSQLSGGMQQRVAIARALSTDPQVLLMDEPFAALDALTRRRMQQELLELWEEVRFTLLFVTHSIEEALVVGNRIALLSPHPGRMRAEINSHGFSLDSLGSAEFQGTAQRIHDMLFEEETQEAAA